MSTTRLSLLPNHHPQDEDDCLEEGVEEVEGEGEGGVEGAAMDVDGAGAAVTVSALTVKALKDQLKSYGTLSLFNQGCLFSI